MKRLKLFDEKKQIDSEIVQLLLDKGSISRYKTFKNYCKQIKVKIDPEEYKLLVK